MVLSCHCMEERTYAWRCVQRKRCEVEDVLWCFAVWYFDTRATGACKIHDVIWCFEVLAFCMVLPCHCVAVVLRLRCSLLYDASKEKLYEIEGKRVHSPGSNPVLK
jgi:hypothetical protein